MILDMVLKLQQMIALPFLLWKTVLDLDPVASTYALLLGENRPESSWRFFRSHVLKSMEQGP